MKEYISKKYEIVARLQLRGKHFEFWFPIKDFPNYEVSTEGRIRNITTGHIIKPSICKNSLMAPLRYKNQTAHRSISKLVLQTFCTSKYESGWAIHLDGNYKNNTLSNLDYPNLQKDMEFRIIESFPIYLINPNGDIFSLRRNCFLHRIKDSKGYIRAVLVDNDGKKHSVGLHRLVAQVFIPNPNGYPQVNHINGVKADNRVKNLEWCTANYNNNHAFKMNLRRTGRELPYAKLKEEYIPWIKKMYEQGILIRQIAKVYDVSEKTIQRIIKNESWKR